MGNTPNYNIYYLSNGDPQSQITESSTQAGTIEAALDNVAGSVQSVNNFGVRFFVNASDRDLALLNPEVGWITQLDSELFMRRWDGAAWVPYGAGLFPLIPSSVSGNNVSMTADGVVEWSNNGGGSVSDATSVCIDGVFTTEFRKFVLDFVVDTMSSDNALFWLRSGGVTQAPPGAYSRAFSHVNGTSYAGGSDAVTAGLISSTGQVSMQGTLEIFGPALGSFPTRVNHQFGGVAGDGTGRAGYGSSVFTPTMLIDGIRMRMTADAATWSGSCRIFGVL